MSSSEPQNDWQRRPSGQAPPQVGYSPPTQSMILSSGGSVVGVVSAGWQIMWSQPSGSPVSQRSQTSVGSSQWWSVPQVFPPHSGPAATSTHEQPVSAESPSAKTSYGRQLRPSAHLPSQVGYPSPPVQGIGGGSGARHASTSASTDTALPVQAPLPSALATAFSSFLSVLAMHGASGAPFTSAFLVQAPSPAAFLPAALILAAAHDAAPLVAASNDVTQSAAWAIAASALPGHAPVSSALANWSRSLASTFARYAGSTGTPSSRAVAWHWVRPSTATPRAFALAPAHFAAPVAASGCVGNPASSKAVPRTGPQIGRDRMAFPMEVSSDVVSRARWWAPGPIELRTDGQG